MKASLEKLRYVSRETILRELWLRGDLSHLLLPDGQMRAYKALWSWKKEHPNSRLPFVVCTHRGAGKSFFLATLGLERCITYPGQLVRFGGPSYKQAVEILSESVPKIMEERPLDLDLYETEGYLRIRNPRWKKTARPSYFWKFGANRETIEAQRGLRTNMLLLDEVRDWDLLDYALNEVLYFQTARMERPVVVCASTPPKSVAHYFWRHLVPEAARDGRYFELTIEDNSDVTDEERDELATACGGRDTVAWKREALCQRITDETLMVVPEFVKTREDVVKEWKKPEQCFKFICADFGLKDNSAILFSYIDFLAQKLVIDSEYVEHFKSTKELAWVIKKERENLAGPRALKLRMWADCTEQQRYDFEYDHRLYFDPAEKYDKWAALAALRSAFHDRRIVIQPCCRNLIYQLEAGIFNRRRTDFERQVGSDGELNLGHLDAIAALIYLWRMCRDYFRFRPFEAEERSLDNLFVGDLKTKRRGQMEVTNESLNVTHNPL